MKRRIYLETDTDVVRFVNEISKIPSSVKIFVVDGEGLRVSARSLIGMMYAMTFNELWCESSEDIDKYIRDFVD